MRYKVFTVVADSERFIYVDDVELSNIEVHNVQIINSPIKINPNQVLIREDEVAFNFDIWADVVDFMDFTKMHMKGSVAVNSFIDDNFPHIKEYYGSQI